jgi:hypothetical protein
MSTSLTPKQRKAVKRVRQALSYVSEPERSLLVAALKEFFAAATAPVLADLEWRIAKEDAMELALEERLGHAPEEGEPITPLDEKRAQEILEMYPRVDT